MHMMNFDFGVEKEYALFGRAGSQFGYFLGVDEILNSLDIPGVLSEQSQNNLARLRKSGWRIEPEFSRSLIEVVSPPFVLSTPDLLLDGYQTIEEILRQATGWVHEHTAVGLDELNFGDQYGSLSNTFLSATGEVVRDWRRILHKTRSSTDIVERAQKNSHKIPAYHGTPEDAARIYAGFTSTHITLHQFGYLDDCGVRIQIEARHALDFWKTLACALELNQGHHVSDLFYPESSEPVQCQLLPREAFLYWADPPGNRMREFAKDVNTLDPEEALRRFRSIYSDGPYTDQTFDSIRAYAAQPRIINNHLMFEFRCFDGGVSAQATVSAAEAIAQTWLG